MRSSSLIRLISLLSSENGDAPRVLTTSSLNSILQSALGSNSDSALNDARGILVREKILQPITAGIYINTKCVPKVVPAEAAGYLRAGAVVSLQYVLGEKGILNNPTDVVTAVVPLPRSGTKVPRTGDVESKAVRFRFHGIPERFFDISQDKLDDHRQLRPFECATPERALIDWLYLGLSRRTTVTPPPSELEIEDLDHRKLMRVAKFFNLEGPLGELLERVRQYSDSPNVKARANTGLGL